MFFEHTSDKIVIKITGNGTALLNIPLKTLINDKKVHMCHNYKRTS